MTYVSENPEEPQPITPLQFIQDIDVNDVPDLDDIDSRRLGSKLRQLQQLREGLLTRFQKEPPTPQKEYLSSLVQHRNDRPRGVKIGDLVLIESEGAKRISWPLGRVIDLHPGSDGASRVATVKTTAGTFTRPLQRLYPLEISTSEEEEMSRSIQQQESTRQPVTTRSGRQVIPPSRFLACFSGSEDVVSSPPAAQPHDSR
ncbi:hypothetical protein GE061_008079 [Apolygus lucorum]|uniref:DUF5641 domain-containing protein n=1 Tax=Apolygus lucorum TaxID=248454 RepID=A0A8S9WQB4_APOLU|nr:hypothetical protein GE061_008079 [Apolygus lucorum]